MSSKKIQQQLKHTQQELAKLIQTTQKEIRKSPPGTVEVRKHGNSVQFYYRNNSPKKNGEYIRAADRPRAIALVNKRYLSRIVEEARKQKKQSTNSSVLTTQTHLKKSTTRKAPFVSP